MPLVLRNSFPGGTSEHLKNNRSTRHPLQGASGGGAAGGGWISSAGGFYSYVETWDRVVVTGNDHCILNYGEY